MPPKPRTKRETQSLQAVLRDARLVEESIRVVEDLGAIIGQASQNQPLKIQAKTTVANEAKVGINVDAGNNAPKLLVVTCDLTAEVMHAATEKKLVVYRSKYTAVFEIIAQSGIEEFSTQAVVPYLAQTNWLAVRRADGSIAATGIANLRLNVPDLVAHLNAPNGGTNLAKPKPHKKRTATPRK